MLQGTSAKAAMVRDELVAYRLRFRCRAFRAAFTVAQRIVVTGAWYLQNPAYFAGGIIPQLRGSKGYSFLCCSAKYAVAFFRISFSIRKSAFSFWSRLT